MIRIGFNEAKLRGEALVRHSVQRCSWRDDGFETPGGTKERPANLTCFGQGRRGDGVAEPRSSQRRGLLMTALPSPVLLPAPPVISLSTEEARQPTFSQPGFLLSPSRRPLPRQSSFTAPEASPSKGQPPSRVRKAATAANGNAPGGWGVDVVAASPVQRPSTRFSSQRLEVPDAEEPAETGPWDVTPAVGPDTSCAALELSAQRHRHRRLQRDACRQRCRAAFAQQHAGRACQRVQCGGSCAAL